MKIVVGVLEIKVDNDDRRGKRELNGDNVLWLRVAGSLNVVAKRPISFFIFTLFGQLYPHSSSEIIL